MAADRADRRLNTNSDMSADCAFPHNEDIFLDDFTLKEVSDTLQVPIDIVK